MQSMAFSTNNVDWTGDEEKLSNGGKIGSPFNIVDIINFKINNLTDFFHNKSFSSGVKTWQVDNIRPWP